MGSKSQTSSLRRRHGNEGRLRSGQAAWLAIGPRALGFSSVCVLSALSSKNHGNGTVHTSRWNSRCHLGAEAWLLQAQSAVSAFQRQHKRKGPVQDRYPRRRLIHIHPPTMYLSTIIILPHAECTPHHHFLYAQVLEVQFEGPWCEHLCQHAALSLSSRLRLPHDRQEHIAQGHVGGCDVCHSVAHNSLSNMNTCICTLNSPQAKQASLLGTHNPSASIRPKLNCVPISSLVRCTPSRL